MPLSNTKKTSSAIRPKLNKLGTLSAFRNPACFQTLQGFFLCAAFIIYAGFSSPTPDAISWAEITIGGLLIAAIGVGVFVSIFSGMALWNGVQNRRFLSTCFLLCLIPASVTGVLAGYETNNILRDIIPLGFFFLPLFLYEGRCRKALLAGVVLTGVVFALRFWPASGLTLARLGFDRGNDEMLYLTSSPAVLFAGLYLLFQATSLQSHGIVVRVCMMVLSLVCLMTIAATLQRGAMVLSVLVIIGMFWHRILRSPHFMYLMISTLVIGGILVAPFVIDMTALIWRKTLEVGDNARLAELHTVLDTLGSNPFHYLFGLGWGAKIVTAASGYASVRYTHMLASYALLKGGLIGLAAVTGYGLWLAQRLVRRFLVDPAVVAAMIPSFILGWTVYPSFKMLCFGAIMALLVTDPEIILEKTNAE